MRTHPPTRPACIARIARGSCQWGCVRRRTPRSAKLAADTSQLVERALDGAMALVSGYQFADEAKGSEKRGERAHSRKLLVDTIDQCYRRLDGSIGRLLIQPRMELSAESLFKAIDAIRDLETKTADKVQEEQLVAAVLRLVAILTKLCDTSRQEKSAAYQLLKAARKGDKEELLRLLAEGVDVNIADNAGHTALMEACQYHHTSCVELLLSRGADVSCTTSLGWSALKFAALDGDTNLPCLKLLLDAKPELETRSEGGLYGNTALHNAAESGYPGVVEALLAAGCSPDWKNADGHTPLDLAIAHKRFEVARMFNMDAGDHCQVVAETARCGSAAVAGWLRHSGVTDETVEAFEKAGITGKDLLWMRQLNPGMGITDPEQVQLVMQALAGLPARRDTSLWRRGKRGLAFAVSAVAVVVFAACAYWYSFFFGYTIAQTWNEIVGQLQG